jgi:hypothetical protein
MVILVLLLPQEILIYVKPNQKEDLHQEEQEQESQK